ncbi:MAG: MBL fold metallo-hydrolase [Planctomycetes bacterium]|nr:MBL fold metallo-hydrolase [Planctomycetota bacterium]
MELWLDADVTAYGLVGETTTWALVAAGRTLLIDCGTRDPARWLAAQGLPPAELVLHTHCQPEHTREGDRLPGVPIRVREGEVERVSDLAAWRRRSRTTWDRPEEWPVTLGREAYGIAGAITRFPPDDRLTLVSTFAPGDLIPFGPISLRVIALPAHDHAAVGFIVERDGRILAACIGDLFRHPGVLVNLYDLEHAYHQTALARMPDMLDGIAALACPLLPSTGPGMPDGARLARELSAKIRAYLTSLEWVTGTYQEPAPVAVTRLGRWEGVHPGVWQIANFGNAALFIDGAGRGLLIDPGPCDFGNPDRERDFIADLERFEREAGLRTIELMLVTHPHGDHYDLAPLVRQRYPEVRLGAMDLVASVIDAPWDHPYPALLPWYGQGRDEHVDVVLHPGQPFRWHDAVIVCEHLPGHTMAHAGYLVSWNGASIACTGDVIQNRGESSTLFFALCNDSPPGDADGCLKTFATMLRHRVDLNLGGHSSRFTSCRELYQESLTRMQHALPYLRALVFEGACARACRRPLWPQVA